MYLIIHVSRLVLSSVRLAYICTDDGAWTLCLHCSLSPAKLAQVLMSHLHNFSHAFDLCFQCLTIYCFGSKLPYTISAQPLIQLTQLDQSVLLILLSIIADIALPWFHSFLSDRSVLVVFGSNHTPWVTVSCSLLQGSAIACLLFVSYIYVLQTLGYFPTVCGFVLSIQWQYPGLSPWSILFCRSNGSSFTRGLIFHRRFALI